MSYRAGVLKSSSVRGIDQVSESVVLSWGLNLESFNLYLSVSKCFIVTLEQRRLNYIDKFVVKTLNNPRYKDVWYPLRDT